MAATITMDLPSANRFVSSLSKSLQALCHGCMDFDTEIEIVGYINVNIDCGSKVDCVLNEKVSKSTNNSMTFISNSFLAKKDQPKQLKDGSCSPVPELTSNRLPHNRGAPPLNSSSQLYKQSGIYSPHSQVVRSSHKRSWSGGDWRSGPRKASRPGRPQHNAYENQSFNESYDSQQTSSYPQSSTSQDDYSYTDTSQTLQSQVPTIKTETLDQVGEENTTDQNNPLVNYSNTNQEDNINSFANADIKADPDASDGNQGATTNTSIPETSDSFFHSQNVEHDSTSQTISGQDTSQHSESFFKTEQGDSAGDNKQDPENYDPSEQYNEPSSSRAPLESGDDPEASSTEQSLSQSLFAEDESQFDIIEIDDEDEDIAAFAADDFQKGSESSPRRNAQFDEHLGSALFNPVGKSSVNSSPRFPDAGDRPTFSPGHNNVLEQEYEFDYTTRKFCCPYCQNQYVNCHNVGMHIKTKHLGYSRFSCKICSRKFQRYDHLQGHLVVSHGMPMPFQCSMCGQKYAHKSSLKNHQKMAHAFADGRIRDEEKPNM